MCRAYLHSIEGDIEVHLLILHYIYTRYIIYWILLNMATNMLHEVVLTKQDEQYLDIIKAKRNEMRLPIQSNFRVVCLV